MINQGRSLSFKHFLITRVNIGYLDGNYRGGLTPDNWLNKRIEIFKTFCMPSILNQKNKNFTWLLYFDRKTPPDFLFELENYFEGFPFIHIKTMEGGFGNLHAVLSKDISDLVKNEDYVITSRVDTDDMLNVSYIERIQALFNYQEYLSINFSKGLVYDKKSGLLGPTIQRSNAFMSLIEKKHSRNLKTVFHKKHREYLEDKERIEIKNGDYMWVVSVHGLNISSGFFARPFLSNRINLESKFNFNFQKSPSFKIRILAMKNYIDRQSKKVFPFIRRKLNLEKY